MAAFFIPVLSLFCGAGVSLFVFSLDTFFRNLPGLWRFNSDLIRSLNRATFRLYRFAFELAATWLGLRIETRMWRSIASALLSCGLAALALVLIGIQIPLWLLGVFLTHGAYVGWAWERLELPEGLWLGNDRW